MELEPSEAANGGGKKFNWSEFPDEGAPPPKPPVRKPALNKKKEPK
jgi:hypothetical protein